MNKCRECGAVVGIDCKRTGLHHFQYYDNDPLKDTMELCNSCHRKEDIKRQID